LGGLKKITIIIINPKKYIRCKKKKKIGATGHQVIWVFVSEAKGADVHHFLSHQITFVFLLTHGFYSTS
jgi:hypothetical protein